MNCCEQILAQLSILNQKINIVGKSSVYTAGVGISISKDNVISATGSGTTPPTPLGRFGIEDTIGVQDRSIDMQQYGFYISTDNSIELQSYNTTHSANSDLSLVAGSVNLAGQDSTTGNSGSLQFATTELDPSNAGKMFFTINGSKIVIPPPLSDIYMPLSITANSITTFADNTGDIDLGTIGGGSGGGLLTASNGLTAIGTDVELGGVLTANTTITGGNFVTAFNSSNIASPTLTVISTGCIPIVAVTTANAQNALQLQGRNTAGSPFSILKLANASPSAVNNAESIEFVQAMSIGSPVMNKITSTVTDVGSSTYRSKLSFSGVYNAGTVDDILTVDGIGQVKLNKYGTGTPFTGTPAFGRFLAVDSGGNIIEAIPSGGGGGGIATASNGLTIAAGSDVQLGGSFNTNATIDMGTSSSQLTISANSGNAPLVLTNAVAGGVLRITGVDGCVVVTSTATSVTTPIIQSQVTGAGGTAFYGISSNGYGGRFQSTSNYAMSLETSNNGLSGVKSLVRLLRTSSGSIGSGGGLDYSAWNSSSAIVVQASIQSEWVSPTAAAEEAKLCFYAKSGGTDKKLLDMAGTGILTLTQGLSNFANDAAAAATIPIGGLYRNGSVVMIRVS